MKKPKYAGFWLRFSALLIDLMILIIVLYLPIAFIYYDVAWPNNNLIYGFWDFALGYVAPVIGTIWFWLRYSATPGKMITNLKVVSEITGDKLTLNQAIGRFFAYFICMLPLGFGLIWIAIDKKKQGWHDKLSGSVVTRVIEDEQEVIVKDV